MMVSNISTGAGSVAVAARPALPKTLATSGKLLMIRSEVCSSSAVFVTDMPGTLTGIYISVPSFSIGMNSEPETLQRNQGRHKHEQSDQDGQKARAQNAGDEGAIKPDQRPVNGIAGKI